MQERQSRVINTTFRDPGVLVGLGYLGRGGYLSWGEGQTTPVGYSFGLEQCCAGLNEEYKEILQEVSRPIHGCLTLIFFLFLA